MKKFVVLLFLVAMSVAGFSQITGQTKRQLKMLDRETSLLYSQVRQDLKSLKYYQQPKHYDSIAVKSLSESICSKKKRAGTLFKRRTDLFDRMIGYSSNPVELSAFREKRRLRSLSVQERELYLRKVESVLNPGSFSSSAGFRGVVKNEYYRNLTLKFSPIRGGESKAVYLYSGQQLYINLLPGVYSVTTQSGNTEGNIPYRLIVPSSTGANFGGERVAWYIVIPNY